MKSLMIEWKDAPEIDGGGTVLRITSNGKVELDKRYPKENLQEARRYAIGALERAEFDNKDGSAKARV